MTHYMNDRPFIDQHDRLFPSMLSLIPNPPERLYYSGSVEVLNLPMIAVVGSRKATDYGRWAAFTIAKRLSESGVCIVSGMAEGIDTWAHKGALEGGTPTIAVLGEGLSYCFPETNRGLMDTIEKSGLLLSEYKDGVHATRYTFPARNRIISGLSSATVVVEAGFSSGALITAEHAVDQGREVYAVPGNINRISSVGCNKLILDGARPLVFIDDILADFKIDTNIAESYKELLSADEKRVMDAVRLHGEIQIDRLAAVTKMPIGALTSVVTLLEIKGMVSTGAGKVFTSERTLRKSIDITHETCLNSAL